MARLVDSSTDDRADPGELAVARGLDARQALAAQRASGPPVAARADRPLPRELSRARSAAGDRRRAGPLRRHGVSDPADAARAVHVLRSRAAHRLAGWALVAETVRAVAGRRPRLPELLCDFASARRRGREHVATRGRAFAPAARRRH